MALNSTELKVEMLRSGVTQQELAKRCDVSLSTVNEILKEKRKCSLGMAEKICDALDISDGKRVVEIFFANTSRNRDSDMQEIM